MRRCFLKLLHGADAPRGTRSIPRAASIELCAFGTRVKTQGDASTRITAIDNNAVGGFPIVVGEYGGTLLAFMAAFRMYVSMLTTSITHPPPLIVAERPSPRSAGVYHYVRRPPISLHMIVARTEGNTYFEKACDLSIVSRAILCRSSVPTPNVTIRNFFRHCTPSLTCGRGAGGTTTSSATTYSTSTASADGAVT